jgi:hypothetical chaperone protein
MRSCGLDFGASNSAVGIVCNDVPCLAPLEGNSLLLPSAVFLDEETRGRVHFGRNAIEAHVGQTPVRLICALKSILGSLLIDEKTALGYRRIGSGWAIRLRARNRGAASAIDRCRLEMHLRLQT